MITGCDGECGEPPRAGVYAGQHWRCGLTTMRMGASRSEPVAETLTAGIEREARKKPVVGRLRLRRALRGKAIENPLMRRCARGPLWLRSTSR